MATKVQVQEDPREVVQEEVKPNDAEGMTQKDKAYLTGLMKMLHSKETSKDVVGMLGSAPPETSVPETALQVFQMFDGEIQKGSKEETPLQTKLHGAVYLIQDLIEIGNSAGVWDQEVIAEESFGEYLKTFLQTYIQKGLEDGSVDPVELQEAVEPLMDEQQKADGMSAGAALGVPEGAGIDTAMETYASKKGLMRGRAV